MPCYEAAACGCGGWPPPTTNIGKANPMLFVLLTAIFVTSGGFLVGASRGPVSPATTATVPIPGSNEGKPLVLRLSPESAGTEVRISSTGCAATLTNVASNEGISGDARD
jgi:hypothetical protein